MPYPYGMFCYNKIINFTVNFYDICQTPMYENMQINIISIDRSCLYSLFSLSLQISVVIDKNTKQMYV